MYKNMEKHKITYWQEGEFYLGYLNEYPDYLSQGYSLEELLSNLKDIYKDINLGLVAGKKHEMELEFV